MVGNLYSERPRSASPATIATRTQSHTASAGRRRTLAWFIRRRPRGLVAARASSTATCMFKSLRATAAAIASGFPDDIAFERWLARLDELDEADRRLNEGGHVSGPGADAYRSRVAGGASRFAGRVIRSGKAARHVLANPSLQIYPGLGATCVFNAATALCELVPSTDDARHTPETEDRRPNCRNIARTDADIDDIRAEAADLAPSWTTRPVPRFGWHGSVSASTDSRPPSPSTSAAETETRTGHKRGSGRADTAGRAVRPVARRRGSTVGGNTAAFRREADHPQPRAGSRDQTVATHAQASTPAPSQVPSRIQSGPTQAGTRACGRPRNRETARRAEQGTRRRAAPRTVDPGIRPDHQPAHRGTRSNQN